MNPTQLNKQQTEALKNGATKLWFPIDVPIDPEIVSQMTYAQTVGSIAIFRHEGIPISVPLPLQSNEQYFVQECTDEFLHFGGTYRIFELGRETCALLKDWFVREQ